MTGALMPVLTGPAPDLVAFDAPLERPLNPLAVDSEDVKAWVEQRKPVAISHWNDLGREEYSRSFAVARTLGQGVINDLYQSFYSTVASGGTEVDFVEEVTPILRRKGWLPDASNDQLATRLRLIYDTNLRLARASGRWGRYQASRTALPYLRGVTGRDERVRHPPKSPTSDHRAWEGIILPIDNPFWTRWWPPLGFRCRCNVIQMTRSQLARMRRGITSEGELAERERRLGTPIFATPGQGMTAQLNAMADANNEDRVVGSPAMLPGVVQARGSSLWQAVLTAEAMKGVEELLKRLFG